jgi:hypothetical protein
MKPDSLAIFTSSTVNEWMFSDGMRSVNLDALFHYSTSNASGDF